MAVTLQEKAPDYIPALIGQKIASGAGVRRYYQYDDGVAPIDMGKFDGAQEILGIDYRVKHRINILKPIADFVNTTLDSMHASFSKEGRRQLHQKRTFKEEHVKKILTDIHRDAAGFGGAVNDTLKHFERGD